jgi:hypothetical protein
MRGMLYLRRAVPLAMLVVSSCATPGPLEFTVDSGQFDVHVRNEAAVPVDQVLVQIRNPAGNLVRECRTGGVAPGYCLFWESRGEYRVHVVPPAGYKIPPTQPHPVTVTVPSSTMPVVHFTLASD